MINHTIISTLSEDQTKSITALYDSIDVISIEQFPGFARANADTGVWHYIQADTDTGITAYAQISVRSFRIATISFGPIAISQDSYRAALSYIRRYCAKNLVPILRVTPPYAILEYGDPYYERLKRELAFETSDREINWSTLLISTDPSDEEILRKFADNHRQSIKKAVQMGLQAEYVSDTDLIDVFSEQHSRMYESRGLETDREKSKLHFRKLFDFFKETDRGYFVVVKENNNIIGGVCCVVEGSAARYMEGYSHPDYRKYPITHIALYHAILIAKKRGLKNFDFGGYANNVAEGDQLYAINRFKEGFRGTLVNYPKTMLIYTLPLAKWLYSLKKR